MKSITIRDFRSRPKQVQGTIAREGEALLTASGRPFAVVIAVDAESVDETVAALRRVRAQQALQTIRESARRAKVDAGGAAVEALIRRTRRAKR